MHLCGLYGNKSSYCVVFRIVNSKRIVEYGNCIMAQTKRVPVFGSRPPCANHSRLHESISQMKEACTERMNNMNKEDFVRFEEEEILMSARTRLNFSYNFVDYIRNREYGMREYCSVNQYHGTRHLLTQDLLKEQCLPIKTMNKVFCSQWLNSKQIVFGTKCAKLMVYNVKSNQLDQISQKKSHASETVSQGSAIHSIKINPSKSLLATNAHYPNDIAVYRLPALDPIVLAKGAHSDLIYDTEWLDDEFFVSGSIDQKLALWQVKDQYEEQYNADGELIQPVTQIINPNVIKKCVIADQIRSVLFNKNLKEIVALSLKHIHTWDVERFIQKVSKKITSCQRNFCMAMKDDGSSYVVGCRSYSLLLDSRTLHTIKKIPGRCGCEIRSISFQDNLITIGSGLGEILFYDLRARKFLEYVTKSKRQISLRTSGRAILDDVHQMMPPEMIPAIFTHCYDYSGTRLFSAGGPLSTNFNGSYAALWM